MLRRGFILRAATCIDALNTQLEDISFWSKYHQQQKSQSQSQQQSFDLIQTLASATLECLEPSHIGSIDIANKTMKRWSEIDQSDEVTQLLAYNKDARENLCDALITHQQNTEFVVYACRAITNMALLPSAAATNSSSSNEENNSTNNEIEHLKVFADKGVVDILLRVLSRNDLFDVVPNGRGAAWVLQALQNLILKSDAAAEKCADFGNAERQRVNPDSLSNAEHDELSQESTAEHFLSVAVLRVLENFTASSRSLRKQAGGRSVDNEDFIFVERVASVSLDSALASIARLLSMSADRGVGGSETTIQHRSEFASPQVFEAVTHTLAELSEAKMDSEHSTTVNWRLFSSPALEHKCWECLRQLVAVRENMPPLLSALHAADGQSGMRILSAWLKSTQIELVPTLFSSSSSSDEKEKHEVLQRTLCGFDVLNELTNASTTAASASSNNSEEVKEYDYEKKALEDAGIEQDGDAESISVSSDDAKTQRWESAMQSITSGTLSKFCVSVLMTLHEKEESATSHKINQNKELALTLGEVKVKCLSLLLHLSQNDTFVRSANCIVVLQRSVMKPFLKMLAKKQMSSSTTSEQQDQDYYYGSLLMCQQKTLSLIWNCLNFTDSLRVIQEMRIQQDVELIVKFCCPPASTTQQNRKATPEEENLKAAGEKLLEKMKIVYLQGAEGKSEVKK